MESKRLLILNGSPRKNKTSYSFALTVKKLAETSGYAAEIIHIIDFFDQKQDWTSLKNSIASSQVISLVTPLYVDTLPYPVIWFLEKLAADFKGELHQKSFFAVSQCGFPDSTLSYPLLESCRFFAQTAGMNWLGGLGYGGGPLIDGALLENLGRKGKKITLAFQLALEDVFQEKKISPQAQELLTVKIPKVFYRPLAAFLNYTAKKTAQKYGVKDLTKKVYLE